MKSFLQVQMEILHLPPHHFAFSAKDLLKCSQIPDLSPQNDTENLLSMKVVPAALALRDHRLLAEVPHCSAIKRRHYLDNVPSQGQIPLLLSLHVPTSAMCELCQQLGASSEKFIPKCPADRCALEEMENILWTS